MISAERREVPHPGQIAGAHDSPRIARISAEKGVVMKEDRHCSGPREHRIHLVDVILKLYLFLDRPKALFDALVSHNRITLEPA